MVGKGKVGKLTDHTLCACADNAPIQFLELQVHWKKRGGGVFPAVTFEPWTAGFEAQTLLLCYSAPAVVVLIDSTFMTFSMSFYLIWRTNNTEPWCSEFLNRCKLITSSFLDLVLAPRTSLTELPSSITTLPSALVFYVTSFYPLLIYQTVHLFLQQIPLLDFPNTLSRGVIRTNPR